MERIEKGILYAVFFAFLWIIEVVFIPHAEGQLTADEIINKANLAFYYAGDDGMARVRMTLMDRGGRKRYRELTMLRKDIEEGGRQNFYLYFHEPSDVRGMVFLVWKHVEKDDDRWLYVPAIDLVKRIATRDKRSSFVGSDFTYEDVSGRSPHDDTHELLKTETIGGRPTYVIKNIPKDVDVVEFSYYMSWIDKESFLPLKIEYYDKLGKAYKVITSEEVKDIQGIPTVVKMRAENLNTGHSTSVEFKEIKYNIGIGEAIFEERFLRRPPREWIR